jgi:hypothetical protein
MKSYFIPGMAPPSTGDRPDNSSSRYEQLKRQEVDFENHPQLAEWHASRKETSHEHSPLSVGEYFWNTSSGDRVAAEVLHEEKDQHTGEIHTTFRESSGIDSGTRRMVWKPGDDARQIVVTSNTKTTD